VRNHFPPRLNTGGSTTPIDLVSGSRPRL